MNYIDMEADAAKWMFTDPGLPVSQADWCRIRPLDRNSSRDIWDRYISLSSEHPMLIEPHEWASLHDTWLEESTWLEEWNSDQPEPPALLSSTETWQEDDIVYFIWMREDAIETTWSVFLRNWKCFPFEDEGPFLYNPRIKEVFRFGPTGTLLYGKKPS